MEQETYDINCGRCGKFLEEMPCGTSVVHSRYAHHDVMGIYQMCACDDCYENDWPYIKDDNQYDYIERCAANGEAIEPDDYY